VAEGADVDVVNIDFCCVWFKNFVISVDDDDDYDDDGLI
jgi:hypothetical protein